MRIAPHIALAAAALLAACGPMSVERAERECFQRARLAAAPRGMVAVGAGSGGNVGAKLSLSVSSDFIQGRDPSAVYDACVLQKSGQPPRQPLYTRSDWRG
ncbi:hypothetical protein [Frigidibacter sp. SD6-1]|uniref:hypothetical protein n=1 Tax=Frigidibacter sp. SD6-1 TaxID=3032581 RepID=UPI0024DF4D5F|nr:hypothetical protein [Frigidibacter sp. SD6-1]